MVFGDVVIGLVNRLAIEHLAQRVTVLLTVNVGHRSRLSRVNYEHFPSRI